MLRFGLKSLLIAFTLVALWFSTFSAYPGAADVRAFIMTAILVTSGVAAYCYTARRRAFWLGFFGTMLVMGTRYLFTAYGGRFEWAQRLSVDWGQSVPINPPTRGQAVLGLHITLVFGTTLIVAVLVGWLCVLVYDHAQRLGKEA